MSGLDETGFEAKTVEEIKEEIEIDQRLLIDPALDLSPEQPLGQINGIFASKLAELWEAQQTLANAFNPNAAENFMLDNVAALTGTTRKAATRTKVWVNTNVNDLFSATAGQITLNVAGQPDVQFKNIEATGTLTPAGVHPVEFECTVFGPVQVAAGTLTVITQPIAGLNSATNPLDGVPGTHVETDEELRKRREDELTAPGSCTVSSIRADLLKVAGVRQCFVLENVGLQTDINGLPGKSIEVVVYDGNTPAADDDEIAQAIWDSKPAGVETVGSTTVVLLDSTGVQRAVKFSRATVRNVWLEFDCVVDSSFFPSSGASLIKLAAAAYGDRVLNLGRDVFANAFKAAALQVTGMLDVPTLRLGFSSSPTGTTNLTIVGREIADVDTSRMIVNVTPGTP